MLLVFTFFFGLSSALVYSIARDAGRKAEEQLASDLEDLAVHFDPGDAKARRTMELRERFGKVYERIERSSR
jgi:hypothetical protein